MYPRELFHDANNTYRVVHSLEEHKQKTAEGWVEHKKDGVAYTVHTARPALKPLEPISPPVKDESQSGCSKCEELKQQFRSAWVELLSRYDKLKGEHEALLNQLSMGVEPQAGVSGEGGANAGNVEPGDAPPLGDPGEAYLSSGKKLTPEQKKAARDASRFKPPVELKPAGE